jgi:hypothetical protein
MYCIVHPSGLRVEEARQQDLLSISMFFGQNFRNPWPLIPKVRGRPAGTGDLASICCGSAPGQVLIREASQARAAGGDAAYLISCLEVR